MFWTIIGYGSCLLIGYLIGWAWRDARAQIERVEVKKKLAEKLRMEHGAAGFDPDEVEEDKPWHT